MVVEDFISEHLNLLNKQKVNHLIKKEAYRIRSAIKEIMHGEELLMELFWRTQHRGYLLEAILILEFGLSIRRYIWQYRLLLIHLYTYWAATVSAFEGYRSFEIKNIIQESMSHQMFPRCYRRLFGMN